MNSRRLKFILAPHKPRDPAFPNDRYQFGHAKPASVVRRLSPEEYERRKKELEERDNGTP